MYDSIYRENFHTALNVATQPILVYSERSQTVWKTRWTKVYAIFWIIDNALKWMHLYCNGFPSDPSNTHCSFDYTKYFVDLETEQFHLYLITGERKLNFQGVSKRISFVLLQFFRSRTNAVCQTSQILYFKLRTI